MAKQKPSKPYPNFPLYAHGNGQWAKKIRGKTRFFGVWSDWREALKLYDATKDSEPEVFNLGDLVNLFLHHKKKQAENGEIKLDTWKEYRRACAMATSVLGRTLAIEDIRGSHFVALRDGLAESIKNPTTLKNVIVKLRVMFEWAYQADQVDRPLRYREALKRPAISKIRIARSKQQKKLFTRAEVLSLLSTADPWMKAAIYLGLNGGLGCRDLCEMNWSHIKGRWVDMPRTKTGVDRRFWLWEETIPALPERRSEWVFCGTQ